MENFKIFNINVSFDNDLPKYADIYLKKTICKNNFLKHYDNEKSSNANDTEQLTAYINKMRNVLDNEIDNVSNFVLDILVQNQILDKSIKDIKESCQKAIQMRNQYINNVIREIEKSNQMTEDTFKDIQRESRRIANNSVEGNYLHLLSSSVWDLTVADYMNAKEEQKVERQREKIYNKNVNSAYKELQQVDKIYAQDTQKTLNADLYKFGILAIESLFVYCIDTLIKESKISSSIVDNLQEQKANTIIENIERLQDNAIIQEQLVSALTYFPFLENLHIKILQCNIDNIEEYVKMIKFLKCEDMIIDICINKSINSLKLGNTKYLTILKLLGNRQSLQKFLDNIAVGTNIKEEIENNKKIFETLKNIFNEDIDFIDKKEKEIFANTINKIQIAYKTTYPYNVENIDYEKLNNFFNDSRQMQTISNLKLQKRRKRLTITFWVLFGIWNCLLIIGKATTDVFLVTDIFILLIYMIVHNILKAIRQNQEKKKTSS